MIAAGGTALVATRGGRMTARLEADGARLAQMPVQSKNPLVMLGNAARLVDLIRSEKVSLVHARCRAPAFAALWAARTTRTPFVATYHGVYKAQSSLKRWYNAVMTRGDLVIANSDYTRDHVLAEHAVDPGQGGRHPARRRPRPLQPGLGDARPGRGPARRPGGSPRGDRRTKFLLAGRLTRIKGHLTIIEAAARMKAAGPRRLPDPLRRRRPGPHRLRRGAGQGDRRGGPRATRSAIVGHCDDMPAAYLLADVAILPTTVPESFGRTAVEPQAMGRPVIASNHGGTTETVVGRGDRLAGRRRASPRPGPRP